jgi:hypothetical protein
VSERLFFTVFPEEDSFHNMSHGTEPGVYAARTASPKKGWQSHDAFLRRIGHYG